jgi:ParB-like chromosome segregation protein Spo0J
MTGMDHSSEWCAEDEQIVRVAITNLRRSRSPRVSGEDPQHIRALAESDAELPPIIVHRATMRVIDGMHRLRAAELRDRDEIDVRFFDGDESDAFVLAVRANVTHGLPLSLTDRKAAAARIVAAHPDWSDRLIASRTGLAAKTVSTMRDENEDSATHDDSRVGQDGRIRPIDSSAGRQIAGDLIAENPGLSLRQVARRAGISPETVRDVRGRLRRGEDPIPRQHDEHNQAGGPPAAAHPATASRSGRGDPPAARGSRAAAERGRPRAAEDPGRQHGDQRPVRQHPGERAAALPGSRGQRRLGVCRAVAVAGRAPGRGGRHRVITPAPSPSSGRS